MNEAYQSLSHSRWDAEQRQPTIRPIYLLNGADDDIERHDVVQALPEEPTGVVSASLAVVADVRKIPGLHPHQY